MKNHTKIYLQYAEEQHGLLPHEILCEVTGQRAVDIHHIFPRQRGGTKDKDTIENLMALSREAHDKYGDKTQYRDFLIQRHKYWMETGRYDYDKR